ncbi:MAG: DUF2262 domain-containing protein [Sandaracinaceae bacterium]
MRGRGGMPGELRAALAALEQVQGGMIGGRVASAEELESVRSSALAAAREEVRAAIDAGPAGAGAVLDGMPPWARSLIEPSLLARLEAVAGERVRTTPVRVVRLPFGAFRWADDIASYVCERPLSVGGLSVTLAVADAGPEEVAERLRAHAWLPSRLEEVVDGARRFAAREGLELHVEGYADVEAGPITAAAFCARLTPTHLSLEADAAVIDFDDGDLFWGHHVAIRCDSTGAPLEWVISG